MTEIQNHCKSVNDLGAISSKRYSKPVKLFIAWMNRRINAQRIRTTEVVLETIPCFSPRTLPHKA